MRRFDIGNLLREYDHHPKPQGGRLVNLSGLDGMDGYNPSGAVAQNGDLLTYVRIEHRDDEFSSWSAPFVQRDATDWRMLPEMPMLKVQDPAVAMIHGTLVVSGVRLVAKTGAFVHFRTAFWRGASVGALDEFSSSPMQLKDTRLVELENGRVGIYTRPLGGSAGRGKIAYIEVDSLDAVTPEAMEGAELLDIQTIDAQWWGPNDIYPLDHERLGILGHVAKFTGGDRHYFAFAAVFDRIERRVIDGPHIICDRRCFPESPAKRPDLVNTVFPASLDLRQGLLFAGLSDACIGVFRLGIHSATP
jgi:hypothetical protein